MKERLPKGSELTTRAKLFLAGLALAATGIFGHNLLSEPQFSEESRVVTVAAGDTLWAIANTVEGHENVDIRAIMAEIKKLNPKVTSEGELLMSGTQLIVPKSVS